MTYKCEAALDSVSCGMVKETLKGNHFLLLRNYDSLNSDHKARLDNLMLANQPLFVMHSMKEQLRLFWVNRITTAP